MTLEGQRFARWSVLSRLGSAGRQGIKYLCRCDCGTKRAVRGATLLRGDSKSCGCLRREWMAQVGRLPSAKKQPQQTTTFGPCPLAAALGYPG